MKNKPEEKKETKAVIVRIDIGITDCGPKTMYLHVTGVPKDLPKEYSNTIALAAGQQFANIIQTSRFLEVYELGKKPGDSKPKFINISNAASIEILDTQIVE